MSCVCISIPYVHFQVTPASLIMCIMAINTARVITARKRSLRRLCFYTCLSFCPQGRGSALVHAGIPPPLGADTPLDQTPPLGADTLRKQTPSPGAVHAGRYGQRAGGMHPTGMQSCLYHLSLGACRGDIPLP